MTCFVFRCDLCVKAHERLEEVKLQAVRDNNVQLVTEILDSLSIVAEKDGTAAELAKILREPHFQVKYAVFLFYTRMLLLLGMNRPET